MNSVDSEMVQPVVSLSQSGLNVASSSSTAAGKVPRDQIEFTLMNANGMEDSGCKHKFRSKLREFQLLNENLKLCTQTN